MFIHPLSEVHPPSRDLGIDEPTMNLWAFCELLLRAATGDEEWGNPATASKSCRAIVEESPIAIPETFDTLLAMAKCSKEGMFFAINRLHECLDGKVKETFEKQR